jgi:hypothetical protein
VIDVEAGATCRPSEVPLNWTQSRLDTVLSKAFDNPPGAQSPGTVDCPSGEYATGGGLSGTSYYQYANASYPNVDSAGH